MSASVRYEALIQRIACADMTDWRDLVLVAADQAGARLYTQRRIARLLSDDDRVPANPPMEEP